MHKELLNSLLIMPDSPAAQRAELTNPANVPDMARSFPKGSEATNVEAASDVSITSRALDDDFKNMRTYNHETCLKSSISSPNQHQNHDDDNLSTFSQDIARSYIARLESKVSKLQIDKDSLQDQLNMVTRENCKQKSEINKKDTELQELSAASTKIQEENTNLKLKVGVAESLNSGLHQAIDKQACIAQDHIKRSNKKDAIISEQDFKIRQLERRLTIEEDRYKMYLSRQDIKIGNLEKSLTIERKKRAVAEAFFDIGQ